MGKKNGWIFLIFLVIGLAIGSCYKKETDESNSEDYYRVQMRLFVQALAAYARSICNPFIVIPQNGQELLTQNGRADGSSAVDYINAITGIAREDLFYGYSRNDESTPADIRNNWLAFTDFAVRQGLVVMIIDYCSSKSFVDDSYQQSFSRGYISFAAHHRELDAIPPYPQKPFQVHSGSCLSLSQARNFLYLINPGSFASKDAFLDALRQSDYDLLVIDLFFNSTALSFTDIVSLKKKANGGSRLVVSYLSIGEAEEYRYYWKPEWKSHPPSWLDKENPEWPGNYKVRYWEKDWQDIVFGNENSYVKRIVDAGFDGVYLDLIDAFEYWEEKDSYLRKMVSLNL